VVKADWLDNPWFPSVLEEERQLDLSRYPDRYRHVWEGVMRGPLKVPTSRKCWLKQGLKAASARLLLIPSSR
jgi:hypothetical protein